MSTPTTGIFQTITAAASEAASALQFQNSFIGSIWWDSRPNVETPFTTLSVNIPTVDEGKVSDIGSGPLAPTDVEHGTVLIPFDKHFSTSFVIKSWDKKRSAQDLAKLYFAPRLEALKRKINRTIVNLVTVANFPNTLVSGAGADKFARADFSAAWAALANLGVPVDDADNFFFLTSPAAWANTLADTAFNTQYTVGESAAIDASQRARWNPVMGARPMYDQHFGQQPFNSGKEPGLLMHRYAISAVTSPPPENEEFEESIVYAGEIPIQVQSQADIKDQGRIVHMHCMWGVAVSRSEYAQPMETA